MWDRRGRSKEKVGPAALSEGRSHIVRETEIMMLDRRCFPKCGTVEADQNKVGPALRSPGRIDGPTVFEPEKVGPAQLGVQQRRSHILEKAGPLSVPHSKGVGPAPSYQIHPFS